MSINEIQEEIIAEFADYDDWMDKYSYLIELGNDMPAFPEQHRKEENIIEGCQSTVWIHAEKSADGKIIYQGDADAIIVKGIVGLLIRVLSGHAPEEILDTELYFIDKVGFKENLTPTRSNGLLAMVKQMKVYAAQYKG